MPPLPPPNCISFTFCHVSQTEFSFLDCGTEAASDTMPTRPSNGILEYR